MSKGKLKGSKPSGGSPKGGSLHSTVKKVGAMNSNNTTPQSFQNPQQAQAATGNAPVSMPPGGQTGATQDWGAEKMPSQIPNIGY